MTNRIARLIASAGGFGFAPVAPGTVGTLVALVPGVLLLQSSSWLLAGILAVSIGGLWATERASGGADHGWIVIDEVAGMWITLAGLLPFGRLEMPRGWAEAELVAVAFLLFRLLDIAKPGPIGWIDRRHASWGVMGDDMLAGVVGALLLLGGRLLFPLLSTAFR